MTGKIDWCSNTRWWAQVGDITIQVEFVGGIWSWMLVENEGDPVIERVLLSGEGKTAAQCKKAATKALRDLG